MRHSGTRLLQKKVFKDFKAQNPNNREKIKDKLAYVSGHVMPPSLGHIVEHMKIHPSVAPMRHPYRVWKSYSDRGIKNPHLNYDYYFDHWMNMRDLDSMFDIQYIHIDNLDVRDDDLFAVEEKLGVNLHHDWTVDKDTSDYNNHDMIVTSRMESMIPSSVLDFYYRTF